MKYEKRRINNTDCYIFTAKPSEGKLTCTAEWSKVKVEDIDHNWYENEEKLVPVSAINCNYFGNGIVGGLYVDSYYERSEFLPDKKWTTCVYANGIVSLDEEYDLDKLKAKYPDAVFMYQAGDPLILDGQKYKGDGSFDHTYGRHPRTFFGQKADGTIVFFVTDGRGGNDTGFTIAELRDVALDLGCVVAINNDGGGSSTMCIEGSMVNNNENRPSYSALMFYVAQGYQLEIETQTTGNENGQKRNLDLGNIRFGNFSLYEFCNSLRGNALETNLSIVYMANWVRHVLGPTTITSCYRTEEFNREQGGSSNSYHLDGIAIDFRANFSGWTKVSLTKLLQSFAFIEYKDGNEIVHKFHNVNFYWDGSRLDRIHADIGPCRVAGQEFYYRDLKA